MGDVGEFWNDMKAERKKKKESNITGSVKLLIQNKIEFKSLNYGTHLQTELFDFWPSTGKFINRKTKKQGRGIFNLIKKEKGQNNA